MEQTVSSFLKALHTPISEKYVQKLISGHPDFPSLVSISDTLQRLGINNVARRIEERDLEELPYPYLLPLDKGRGDILLIKNKYDLVKHKNDLKEWGGVILQAEAKAHVTDGLNNKLYLQEVRIKNFAIGLMLVLGALLLFPFLSAFHSLLFAILLTAIAGAVTGYFLIAKELGVTYAVIDAFCKTGKNANCDKVLDAEVNFFGIKFSDAVLIYFLFQIITITTSSIQSVYFSTFMQVLAWLSILTIPIIVFSLYYQYFIAKTWCRLCLVVVAILALQFTIFAIGYFRGGIQLLASSSLITAFALALLLAGIAFLVMLVKAIVERSNGLEQLGMNGNRVKHSSLVFTQLLVRQKKIDTNPFGCEIVLGSPDAPINIIAVSGLYCNPCKIKHQIIDQLIKNYVGKVSVTLRFVPDGKDVRALGYLLGYWYQSVHNKDNQSENTIKLMSDWFDLWDLEKFMKKYPVNTNDAEIEKIESQHYRWVNEVGIKATPTFFINGYELPKEYTIDDLLVLIPSLADNFSETEKIEVTL